MLLVALSFTTLAPPLLAQPDGLGKRIDAIAQLALEDGPIAGLSIAVAHGDELWLSEGYGLADVATGTPATDQTIYDIASITKLITAAAALKLVESGELRLDDDLASLLPAFPNPAQGARIQLRHLLSHTSGLADYENADTQRWLEDGTPLEAAFVLEFINGRPLDFEPGSSWSYSNTGYYLVGLILERVTGESYGQLIRTRVLDPLGLDEIFLCDDQQLRDRWPLGYEPASASGGFRSSRLYGAPNIRADGGLCSTVRALVALPRSLTRANWLSEPLLDAMLRPTRLKSGALIDYGIGVRRGSLEGQSLWGHTGGMTTYWSTVTYYPEEDVTIAVLVNTDGAASDAVIIQGHAARAVFGFGEPHLADQEMQTTVAAQLAGLYGFGGDAIEIVQNGRRIQRRSSVHPSALRPLLLQPEGSFGYEAYPMDRVIFHWQGGAPAGISEYHNGIFATYRPRSDRSSPSTADLARGRRQ